MSPRRSSEALKAFLTELSDLTKKYGFQMDAAGYDAGLIVSGNRESVDIYWDSVNERYVIL
ncbi:hypothetical protein ACG2OD_14370 [Streptomyces sp. PDY-4]|uniref:hypothetical protein n=1 Tax=Streptomyces sp. PDY-4 TaxID=3376070 RepID=UPI0037AEFA24